MMGNTKRNCKPKGGKGKFMKKNIFKKIVASLATAAMAVGMFAAAPAQEVKAAADGKETEIVLLLSDSTGVANVYLDIYNTGTDGGNQNASIDSAATKGDIANWGRQGAIFTQDSTNKNVYKIITTGSLADDEYCNMQFVIDSGDSQWGYKYYPQNNKELFNGNKTIYFTIDVSNKDWPELSASTVDPTAAKPSDIMAVIDAIGTVELTSDSLKKIEAAETAYNSFTGDKSAVTNYDKLTAARTKYNQLQAAEDAKSAGKLTVYVKNADWKQMKVYGWDGAEFGDWPGLDLTALKNNAGWYSCSFDITKATNLIFNDGTTQTVNWEGVAAGTYWVTLSEKDADGKYLVDDTNVSTKAPEDWKDEAAQEIENSAPTTTTQAPVQTTTVPTIIPQADVDKIAASATITGAPADSSLKFSVISENEAKTVESFKSSTLKGMTFQALDIKLLDKDGNAVQPGSKVDITVALTDGLKNAKKVEVFRVDGDKLTSLGQVDAKDGKITFTTDHFSTYVFASVQSANKTGDMSSVAIMFAVAAMAGVAVMAMRKKTVNE